MKTILMIQISKQGAIAYQKMKQNGITHATKTRTIPPVLLDSETCKRRFPMKAFRFTVEFFVQIFKEPFLLNMCESKIFYKIMLIC